MGRHAQPKESPNNIEPDGNLGRIQTFSSMVTNNNEQKLWYKVSKIMPV